MDGIELEFDKSAIKAVAKKAIELKTGARGLRTILEERMLDVMYTSHFDQNIEKIIIDENYILGNDKPIINGNIKNIEIARLKVLDIKFFFIIK